MTKTTINLHIDQALPDAGEAKRIITHFYEQINQNKIFLTDYTRAELGEICSNFNSGEVKIEEFRDNVRMIMNAYLTVEDVTVMEV